jgi:ABC-type sugar transport system ATPase subunit
MHRPVCAQPAGLGQRARIAAVGLHPPAAGRVHGGEVRIGHHPVARRELRVSLRAWLRSWRLPAPIVSHDPADAALADRIAVVDKGRVVQQGTLLELRRAAATSFVSRSAV